MSFQVLGSDGIDSLRWQSFYDRLPVFFRSIHFSPAYARAYAALPRCAVLERKDSFVMQPFWTRPDAGGSTMENVYGYGGPITNTLLGVSDLGIEFEQCMNAWRAEAGIICERMVLHPRLAVQVQTTLLPPAVLPLIRKEVVIVRTEAEAFRAGVTQKRRSAIEKAVRDGISTKRSTSRAQPLSRFVALYGQTMRRVNAAPRWKYSHPFFDKIMAELKGQICVIEAFKDNVVVSAAIVLISPPQAYYQYAGNSGVSGASDLLIVDAVRLAAECGCDTLDLGGGVTTAADDPVLFYKATFSKDCRADVYVLERVYDQHKFDEASKGFEGIGYFPPWRAGEQVNAATQGVE